MKKLFGELNMKWLWVILFALAVGIYTGAVMMIPLLKETSFQDIGVTPEWWVVFAVIIVTNCKKNWEAALKCFVFFLISQPVVYLVQVAFGTLSFEMAKNYYIHMWLPMTFATLPGGFIAFYCKKQNLLGSIIMGLGNTIELALAAYYLNSTIHHFPHHLLTVILCIAFIVIMTLCIQKEAKWRVVSFVTPVVLVLILAVVAKFTGLTLLF